MPVLYASGYDQGSLAPLSAAAKTQQEASNQAPTRLSAKLQSLDEAASLAPMNGLLADLAKHPQGSAALDSTLASAQASTQQSQFSNAQLSHAAEPDLFRSAVKELEIASDIKNVLQGTRAEIRQIAGGLVGDQAEQAAELAELRRRVEEGHTKRYADGSAYDRPRSEAEIRADSMRASLLVSQLIDEVTPWAIGVGVLLALFHASRAMLRLQAGRQLKAVRAAGEVQRSSSQTGLSASAVTRSSTQSSRRSGARSSKRSSTRSSSRSSTRTRSKWF